MRPCARFLIVVFALLPIAAYSALPRTRVDTAPPPRSRAEVESVVAKAPAASPVDSLRDLNIVLVAGPKDHGANAHDYPVWQKRWATLLGGRSAGTPGESQVNLYGPAPYGRREESLKGAPKVNVETAQLWPSQAQLQTADLIVTQCYVRWNDSILADLEQYLDRGGGFVAIHPVVITNAQWSRKVADLIGLAWEDGYTRFREGPLDVTITSKDHPICLGLPEKIHFLDEAYWPLKGDQSKIQILGASNEAASKRSRETTPQPMYWTSEVRKGRVFVCLPGHNVWSFDDPYFRLLLLRGMAWAAGESPYRFDALALRDAVLSDDHPARPARDRAFLQLRSYGWDQSRAPLAVIDETTSAALARNDAATLMDLAHRYAEVLTAEATIAGKQYACRELSRIGSGDSVPALAALLASPDLSDMARLALERIPGPAASQALLQSLPGVKGEQRIGVVDSLGVLRAEQAVPALAGLLADSDAAIAGAAANALGKIGTSDAARALADSAAKASGPQRAALIDAALNAASLLVQAGKTEEGARICDGLLSAENSPYVQAAALQIQVAARPDQAGALLIRALRSSDKRLQGAGARMVRETSDNQLLKAVVASFSDLPGAGQVLVLNAVGDRGYAGAKPDALWAIDSQDLPVRAAALRALGALGDRTDVARLAQSAASSDAESRQAARDSLARLAAPGVNQGIIESLPQGDPKTQVELLRALAARNATETTPAIAKAAESPEAQVRQAAVESLAVLADESQIPAFVQLLKTARNAQDLGMVEKAMAALVGRLGEPCADGLVGGLEGAAPEARAALLRTLAKTGGAKALAAVRSAAQDEDAEIRRTAVRGLADWPTPEPMADLLGLAKAADSPVERTVILRGFVRMIGLPSDRPPKDALAL
ncbi:MAG: HEAT repeat domain-containing protein, partial [Candidatus Sumerlaeota bacterium]|nr:HEAT repeat domain-containing protein [Candidatus Sumerlaeota bacterium]